VGTDLAHRRREPSIPHLSADELEDRALSFGEFVFSHGSFSYSIAEAISMIAFAGERPSNTRLSMAQSSVQVFDSPEIVGRMSRRTLGRTIVREKACHRTGVRVHCSNTRSGGVLGAAASRGVGAAAHDASASTPSPTERVLALRDSSTGTVASGDCHTP
jgi:hypothetical protein